MRATSRSVGEVLAVANLYIMAVLYLDGIEMVLYFIPPLVAAIAGVAWSRMSTKGAKDAAPHLRPSGRNHAHHFAQIVAPELSMTAEQQKFVIDWAASFINRAAQEAGLPPARQRSFRQLVKSLDTELQSVSCWKQQLLRVPSWRRRFCRRMLRAPFAILRRRRERLQNARSEVSRLEKLVYQLEQEVTEAKAAVTLHQQSLMATVASHDELLKKENDNHVNHILQWRNRESDLIHANEDLQRKFQRQSDRIESLRISLADLATDMRRDLDNAPLLDLSEPEVLLKTVTVLSHQLQKFRRDKVVADAALKEATRKVAALTASNGDLRDEVAELRERLNQATALPLPEYSSGEMVARYLACPESYPELVCDTALLLDADLPLETAVALLHHMCLEPEWALTYLAELSAIDHCKMVAILIRLRPEMLEVLLWNAATTNAELLELACAVLQEWKPKKEDLISPANNFPPLLSGGSLSGLETVAFWEDMENGWPREMTIAARTVFLELLRDLSEFDRHSPGGLLQTIERRLLRFTETLQCKW